MHATIARRIGRLCLLFLAIGAAHSNLPAQTATRRELQFDAASVRPNRTAGCHGRWDFRASHGSVTAVNAPLLRIISRAYNMTDDRVLGPGWMEAECYDIAAKASDSVTDHDLQLMLQALLEERFHLVAHRESEERSISVLLLDKGVSKLRPYGAKAPDPEVSNGTVLFMVRHLPDLCERLGKVTGRPVVDKTGLDGDYRIVLAYLPLGSTGDGPDIVSAVRDQLGLRLESQRGAVEVLKIESVNKVPSGN